MTVRLYLLSLALACGLLQPAQAVGPFELTDPDSSVTLRLQLAVQLQSALDITDRETEFAMQARRIRPGLLIKLPRYNSAFRLQLSTAPGSVELMDFYFESALNENLSVRAGQYKIPFTRYRTQSFQRLTFVDWSMVTKYFGAERQIGFSLHNSNGGSSGLAFALGVFNGVNARSAHLTKLASLYGEKLVNRSDLAGPSYTDAFHPELTGYLSYNSPGIDVNTDSDMEGGGFRYAVAASAAWDTDPERYEEPAVRVAQEILIKNHGLSLAWTGYAGLVETAPDRRLRLGLIGFLAQTACRVASRLEVSVRYAYVDVRESVADAAYERAQTVISESSDDAITNQYQAAGLLLGEQEFTAGFTWYLDDHRFKWQNDAGLTTQDLRDGHRTDYLVRSQLQLAF